MKVIHVSEGHFSAYENKINKTLSYLTEKGHPPENIKIKHQVAKSQHGTTYSCLIIIKQVILAGQKGDSK